MKAIINGKVITEQVILHDRAVIYDNTILEIIDMKKFEEISSGKNHEVFSVIDAKGMYVGPGFIDLHIHGAAGWDTMDGSLEGLMKISEAVSRRGVTGFLPTTMTMEKSHINRALDTIREAMNMKIKGAKVLGAHMEGPFINPKYKGAQAEEHILFPDYEFIENYLDIIKIITLAPELEHGLEFIKKVKKNSKVVLSIGHSNASFEEAMQAIEGGISHATHTFNAMTPLNHRNPGIVGAVFNSDISCELIADTVHVHPAIFKIMVKVKGVEKVVLVTDCIRAGGMQNGTYDLGGQSVKVEDGSARLMNGTLAGSILDMNLAVNNILKHTELSILEAVTMASLSPAKVIGMDERKGSIKEGKDSDLIIFDGSMKVFATIVEGETVFSKQ